VAEAMLLAAIAIFGTLNTVSSEAGKYWQICRGHLLFFGVGHRFDPRRCWWGPLAALSMVVFDSGGQRPFFGALGYILFWQLNMIAQSNIFLGSFLFGVFRFLGFLNILRLGFQVDISSSIEVERCGGHLWLSIPATIA
jgi:hypothetical protein